MMKEKKQKKSDEYIAYRVMLAFVASAVFLLLMAKLRNVLDVPTTFSQGKLVSLIIAIFAAAGAVIGVISYFASVKRDKHQRGKVFNGMFFAYFSAVVSVSALILYFNHILGMKAVYVFIPASAILFLIYSVYPKQLFVTSVTHFYAAFTLFALSRLTDSNLRVIMLASALALCVLALGLFFATRKNAGRVIIAGTDFIIFSRDTSVKYMCILYAATAAVLLAGFILGAAVAFYCMIAVIAFVVVSIVHSTVRMM